MNKDDIKRKINYLYKNFKGWDAAEKDIKLLQQLLDAMSEAEGYKESLITSKKAFWNILQDADNPDGVKQISNGMFNYLTKEIK